MKIDFRNPETLDLEVRPTFTDPTRFRGGVRDSARIILDACKGRSMKICALLTYLHHQTPNVAYEGKNPEQVNRALVRYMVNQLKALEVVQ